MKAMDFKARRVLVTGASAGLGQALAREFARDGAQVVLVARRRDRLEQLKTELEAAGSAPVTVIAADLATPEGVERVFHEATQSPLYAAVLNAGATHFGDWDEQSWPACEQLLALNVTRLVQLTRLLLTHLEQRAEGGGLMLVGSLLGVTPAPYQSVYSATKAFVNSLGLALYHEMRPRGVSVTTFVPGGIDTEMTANARFNELRAWLMPADRCAREAVDAMRKRRFSHSPGLTNQASALLLRALPQRLLTGQLGVQYRRSMHKNAGSVHRS
jgi:uncharacterized protein